MRKLPGTHPDEAETLLISSSKYQKMSENTHSSLSDQAESKTPWHNRRHYVPSPWSLLSVQATTLCPVIVGVHWAEPLIT